MRPALVWGWSSSPARSISAIVLRSVAGEKLRFIERARLSEPTGCPVAMWSWIRVFSTSRLRSSSSCVCLADILVLLETVAG